MNKGLSRREKFLVTICLIVVFTFILIRFVVTPLSAMRTRMLEERESLYEERTRIEAELIREPATRAEHKRAEEAHRELAEKYPAVMPSESVDFLLTGICVRNNLYPITLGISDPVPLGGRRGGNSLESAAFLVVSATMTLGGDYNALKGLIDTVAGIEYISIRRFSFKWIRDGAPSDSPNITVLFEVTMLN